MSSKPSWLDAMHSIGIKGVEALDPLLIKELQAEMESDRKARSMQTLSKIRLIRASQKQASLDRKEDLRRQMEDAEELRHHHKVLQSQKSEEWRKRLKAHDTKRAEERKRLLDIMRSEEEKRQRNKRSLPLAELFPASHKDMVDAKVQTARTVKPSPSLEAINEYLTRRSDPSLFQRMKSDPLKSQYTRRMKQTTYAHNTRLAALVYNVKP